MDNDSVCIIQSVAHKASTELCTWFTVKNMIGAPIYTSEFENECIAFCEKHNFKIDKTEYLTESQLEDIKKFNKSYDWFNKRK